jgi:hypothetical protein
VWFRACFRPLLGITPRLRDQDPVLLSLSVIWNRLLVVAVLGAAILLFRASYNSTLEIQDTRGDVEASVDDGTPMVVASAGVEPALLDSRRFEGEREGALAGHQFVSEIFRPPIAPLARA